VPGSKKNIPTMVFWSVCLLELPILVHLDLGDGKVCFVFTTCYLSAVQKLTSDLVLMHRKPLSYVRLAISQQQLPTWSHRNERLVKYDLT